MSFFLKKQGTLLFRKISREITVICPILFNIILRRKYTLPIYCLVHLQIIYPWFKNWCFFTHEVLYVYSCYPPLIFVKKKNYNKTARSFLLLTLDLLTGATQLIQSVLTRSSLLAIREPSLLSHTRSPHWSNLRGIPIPPLIQTQSIP